LTHSEFYSNGKLLLTGEYLVMHGALALAVPVKFGQSLRIGQQLPEPVIEWESLARGKQWFRATMAMPSFEVISSSDPTTATNLARILSEAGKLNRSPLDDVRGYQIKTLLSFDRNWGLGSSSTLISNIAYWFDIDPFELFWNIYDGSGYDIACARAYKPLTYKLVNRSPEIQRSFFFPEYHKQIWFVYTGEKAATGKSIQAFRQNQNFGLSDIETISSLTEEMTNAANLHDFERVVREHECVISKILKAKPVSETSFGDLEGAVKSLGAWGGDFVMITWRGNRSGLKEYLRAKGLEVFFRYDEMVL